MFEKIIYRRVNTRDITNIQRLFFNNFKKKISKNFYKKRYFAKKNYNSFVAIFKDNIIAHVGFVKYQYGYDSSFIFSRHTSFVNINYRNLGIYKNLCLYSYKKLSSKKKYKIITWPNKLNVLSKPHTKFFYKKEAYYLFKKEHKVSSRRNIYNSKNRLLKNLNKNDLNNLFILSKKNNFIINKNSSYFKFRFKDNNISKNYVDFFSHNNSKSAIIFSKVKFYNHYKVNILSFFGDDNIFSYHLQNLIKKFYFKKNFIIQIFVSISEKRNFTFFKKMKFIKYTEIFNIIILSNKLISDKEKKYLQYSRIAMADTDVFISLN